jgi:phosphosulfolactate phosphohydrolase-like enzyme
MGGRTDSAKASEVIARAYPHAVDGINARTYGPPGLEDDVAWCSQESLLDVVPRFTRMVGNAAEVTL